MNTQYKKLFGCEVRHEYYPTPAFDTAFALTEDFALVPTPETRQMLADYQLLFRSGSAGFKVLYREQIGPQGGSSYIVSPDTDIPSGTRFTFEMHLKNPYLNNFTDIFNGLATVPRTAGSPMAHFDNLLGAPTGNLL